jgi:Protein of unknown function (DUF1592)/Protein of unknown function (DUF1588)/Protein of unknown function (DUF1587)/Protein of unknown function (DUF1595)/Protein of unknown function (DUF1585)
MSGRLCLAILGTWRIAVVVLGLGALGMSACKGQVADSTGAGTPGAGTGTATGSGVGVGAGGSTGAGIAGVAGTAGGGTGTAGAAAPGGPLDVGISTAIRLNRTQYNNTVRDLLGTTLTPADNFPPDETSLGFDTLGGTLQLQPERQDAYLSASATLISELLARPTTDALYKRAITCDYAMGATCPKQILTAFATRAWRRPAVDAELAPYVTLAAAGPTPKDGLSAALRAVLVSANFIYRLEHDPDPNVATAHRLNGYELATRLSYFLWATMPDDALFADAAAGKLLDDASLKAAIARMLADATRARPLVDTFGAEWLGLGKMQSITPDATLYPMFNDTVRAAMIEENKRFVLEFLTNGKAIPAMLSADFTYVNATLAAYYGLPAVTGAALQRVPVAGTNRTGGLLTLGSYLAGESNPNRTSPVKRGLFVLDRLLCSAPPPPPPNVNTNIDQGSGLENLPLRQRLAQHQKLGAGCAACHSIMDSIGLGLENFDGAGRYRAADDHGPIDATGTLPGGGGTVSFDGVSQLAAILAADPRFVPCVVQKLLTFSIGRDFSRDTDLRDQLTKAAGGSAANLRGALESVVMSDAFRSRRAALQTEVMP